MNRFTVGTMAAQLTGALAVGVVCAQAPVRDTGTLRVEVTPAAWVYVEGERVGGEAAATSHQTPVQIGQKLVRIQHPDYHDWVRVVSVKGGETLLISLVLEEKGVRRLPASAGGGGGPTGGLASAAIDQDVRNGVDLAIEGNLEFAIEVLYAAAKRLAGNNPMLGQRALAYFYLGTALAELDHLNLARQAFAIARRLDRGLTPKSAEFSRWILNLWADEQPMSGGAELDLTALIESFNAPANGNEGSDSSLRGAGAVITPERRPSEAEFIFESGSMMTVNVVAVGATKNCPGSLRIERDNRILEWAALDPACLPGFRVPFSDVRSPAASPRSGLFLQFRSERPAMILMPMPDADLVEPGVERTRYNDLPGEAQVNLRRANSKIIEAMGRASAFSLFGIMTEVSLEELLTSGPEFEGGLVRTQGKLGRSGDNYTLSDGQRTLRLNVGNPTVNALLKNQSTQWVGQEMLVRGTFSRLVVVPTNRGRNEKVLSQFVLGLSQIEPLAEVLSRGTARTMSLEDLVKEPPSRREKVTVVGQFRGFHNEDDLPLSSRNKGSQDWVIKDDLFAIWVTGKPPMGKGFEFFGDVRLHSQSWVSVTGSVEKKNNFLYLHADRIELSAAPSELRAMKALARRSGSPHTRPDINYFWPAEEEELSRGGAFLVQFTKPMDEESFKGRVQLRYADGPPGDFSRLIPIYVDDTNRAMTLTVDPGVALQAGRTLELLLLPGIKDVDSQLLVGTDSSPRILRWKVKGR